MTTPEHTDIGSWIGLVVFVVVMAYLLIRAFFEKPTEGPPPTHLYRDEGDDPDEDIFW